MPWPKGTKRVGYVKKDGTAHAKKGERVTAIRKDKPVYKQEQAPVEGRVEKTGPVLHGMTNQAVIEVCPNCAYAYADGGYCPECGWTQYRSDCNHCTNPRKGK